jgi:hypothetical protein
MVLLIRVKCSVLRGCGMFGWYLARIIRKGVAKDIRTAQGTIPSDVQILIARELGQRMASLEHHGNANGTAAAMQAAKDLLIQSTKDRHVAVGKGNGTFSDPAWLLASLSEAYASARLGSLNGKISLRNFRKIDAMLVGFLIDTIGPAEIRAMASGLTARVWRTPQ